MPRKVVNRRRWPVHAAPRSLDQSSRSAAGHGARQELAQLRLGHRHPSPRNRTQPPPLLAGLEREPSLLEVGGYANAGFASPSTVVRGRKLCGLGGCGTALDGSWVHFPDFPSATAGVVESPGHRYGRVTRTSGGCGMAALNASRMPGGRCQGYARRHDSSSTRARLAPPTTVVEIDANPTDHAD
jgi:hypothetical protein